MSKRPRTTSFPTTTTTTATAAAVATATATATAEVTAVINLYHNNNNDDDDGATHAIANTTRNRNRNRNRNSSSSSQRSHRKRVHNDARMDSVTQHVVRSKTSKIQPSSSPPVVDVTVIDLCVSPTTTTNNNAGATTTTTTTAAVTPMVYHLDLNNDDDDDRKPAAASLRNHHHDSLLALQMQQQLFNENDDDDDNLEVDWNDCIAIFEAASTATNDYEVALELQHEEERTHKQWRDSQNQHSDKCMTESPTGKAWKFVERVLAMVERLRAAATSVVAFTAATEFALVTPIATDNLVFLTERTLVEQADFFNRGKPTVVDLGYHYTRTSNLIGIRDDGLLSRVERSEKQIVVSKENGASYGEGIYTAKDPSAFASYGDIGLLVARLQGHNGDYAPGAVAASTFDSWTVRRNVPNEITVLSSAPLCIPILQFPSTLLTASNAKGKLVLEMYQKELLGIVNEFFNQNASMNCSNNDDLSAVAVTVQLAGHPTPMHAQHTAYAVMHAPPSRNWSTQNHRHRPRIGGGKFWIPVQPIVSATAIVNESIQYTAPETMGMSSEGDLWNACQSNDVIPNSICTICLDPMLGQCMTNTAAAVVVALHKCGHQFHLDCIQQALGHGPSCPTCRRPLQNPQGIMPSGTMAVQHQTSIVCAGFEPAGSIVIQYSIPSSAQKMYHPHPGVMHGSAHRVTYIPYVPAGWDLLKRLKFAFQHGLTFTVGVSMASGQDNSVTWASIHHKTSYHGGTSCHGFPDPGFFVNCNEELDALFVPRADHL